MRGAYALLGLGVFVLGGLAWYGLAHRPAADHVPTTATTTPTTPMPPLTLTSPAFSPGAMIPAAYTCDGDRYLSPPLTIAHVPAGTKSLALIMEDPDVPKALVPEGVFVHWVLYDIPPTTTSIPEGKTVGNPGGNGQDDLSYTGPCPPADYEPATHRYIFTLYALSGTLEFFKAPTAADVIGAVKGMTIAKATLTGVYSSK